MSSLLDVRRAYPSCMYILCYQIPVGGASAAAEVACGLWALKLAARRQCCGTATYWKAQLLAQVNLKSLHQHKWLHQSSE